MVDARTGEVHDFRKRSGVAHSEIMAPEHAPNWMLDRAQLWESVEAVEKRSDAQLSREFNVALPVELTKAQQIALAQDFVQRELVNRGMVVQLDLHDLDSHNPHFHAMATLRDIEGDGWGKKNRDWNRKELLQHWREAWAKMANEHLERAGRSERIDHRSLVDQGIDREPTRHLGPHAAAVERKEAAAQERVLAAQISAAQADLEHLANELDDQLARDAASIVERLYAEAEVAMAEDLAQAQAAAQALEQQRADLHRALAVARKNLVTRPAEALSTDNRVQTARSATQLAAEKHRRAAGVRWRARDNAEAAAETATRARQAVAEWRQAHPLATWWHDHLRPIARLSQLTEAANQAALTSRDAQEQAKIAERHAIAAADTQRARTAKQVQIEASVRAEAQQLAQAEVTRIEAALSALEPLQPPITSQTDQTLAWVRDRLLGQKRPAGPPTLPDRER